MSVPNVLRVNFENTGKPNTSLTAYVVHSVK